MIQKLTLRAETSLFLSSFSCLSHFLEFLCNSFAANRRLKRWSGKLQIYIKMIEKTKTHCQEQTLRIISRKVLLLLTKCWKLEWNNEIERYYYTKKVEELMSQNDSDSDVTSGGTEFRKNKNMLCNMRKARGLLHWDTFEIVFFQRC